MRKWGEGGMGGGGRLDEAFEVVGGCLGDERGVEGKHVFVLGFDLWEG